MNIKAFSSALKPHLQIPFWWHKLTRFEYWPFWVLYFPIFINYFWLSIKARSLCFFSAANPSMHLGGMLGESKSAILNSIPDEFKPKTSCFAEVENINETIQLIEHKNIEFPFIIKPDIGERGDGVALIPDKKTLLQYLESNQKAFIIQDYIQNEIELGVLYYRFPDGTHSGITSITGKTFLSIEGDGINSLHHLLLKTERAQLRLDYLLNKFQDRLNEIIPLGYNLLIEPIGNHCRGTAFINLNNLINPDLVKVFDQIAIQIPGFYIGRFDLKVKSISDFQKGKNIQIMELNGVSSEPAHIYDPETALSEAYAALFYHYSLIYKIAKQNKKLGIRFAKFNTLVTELVKHYSTK